MPPSVRTLSHPMAVSSTHATDTQSGGGGCGVGGGLLFVLILIILVVIILASRRGRDRAKVESDTAVAEKALADLVARDPSFSKQAFAERTRATMQKVNDAWIRGDMSPVRRLISDGVYVRFQTQLALLRQGGLRNAMADWKPTAQEILAADTDASWDTVHVKVAAEARDADVAANLPEAEALKQAKSASLESYEEVWSFVRRRGQKTKAGVPALEGNCPNCGAPLELGEVVKCKQCGALANSGEHDWVLAEITQPEEWSPMQAGAEIDGLAGLRVRDANISRQELEDRASVIFWKWIDAIVTGDRKRLERFCLTAGQPGVEKLALTQVAVGSAEIEFVKPGDDQLDHAGVEIRWSASVGGKATAFVSELLIARRQDALSKRGMSSLDCPNCGAPAKETDAVQCSYCGEKFAGGKKEWSLESISLTEQVDV